MSPEAKAEIEARIAIAEQDRNIAEDALNAACELSRKAEAAAEDARKRADETARALRALVDARYQLYRTAVSSVWDPKRVALRASSCNAQRSAQIGLSSVACST